ncbi:MAG: hypothetical protein Q9165_006442 [Trypethelium subeluteriae]
MEYRRGKTILSVRNSIDPLHLSSSTSLSCSTDTPESGELEQHVASQHIASQRANAQNLLEGLPSNTVLLEISNATAKPTDEKCGNGNDLADPAQYVNTETCWPFAPSTPSQGASQSSDAQKAYNSLEVEAALHQHKYIPYHSGPQDLYPNGKASKEKTPALRPERPNRYSAAHPDGLLVSSEPVGVALGCPSWARVPKRKPLPAHFLKKQSRRTSRHPDSLFMERENSRLRRAQAGGSNLRDQFAADMSERDLVPAPLIVSQAYDRQSQQTQTQRAGLDLNKPLPTLPHSSRSPDSSHTPQVATRVPSPQLRLNFSRRLVTRIPSPELHLSFSASVYNTDSEYGTDEESIITVALSPADFPPELSMSSTTLGAPASTTSGYPLPDSATYSTRNLPPTPGESVANFDLGLFSLYSHPDPDKPHTTFRRGPPPTPGTKAEAYDAYQRTFAAVPDSLKKNRRRGRGVPFAGDRRDQEIFEAGREYERRLWQTGKKAKGKGYERDVVVVREAEETGGWI